MRKSSLGRRSSTHIPVRVPSIGGSSAQKTCSGGKKRPGSLLKQPGFTQTQVRQRRSQSEDRESHGGRPVPPIRSSTSGNLPGRGMSSMTPITPRQSLHSNLPTSSVRPPRSQTLSSGTDANRRMSSFGGAKGNRKDSRPINDKAFLLAAQSKIQQYFDEYGKDILSPGVNIKPMNTQLFVDMMDFLLKKFDSRIVMTKSNYLEEVPNIMKRLTYRSKVERSWLMTVNTPHSWPHVVAVLSWLIDGVESMTCVDPLSMMYNSNIEQEEDLEDDISIDSELVSHLKSSYRVYIDPNKTNEDKEAIIDDMDSDFISKQIIELKCTDEDFETIKRSIELIKEEVEIEKEKRDSQLELLKTLISKRNALASDCQSAEGFIEQSSQFISSTTNEKLPTLEKDIMISRSILTKKQEELHNLQEKISCQKISLEEKEKLTKEKHELHRMIQFYENSIREFENSAFTVDLKCAEEQRKLDTVLVEYNNIVTKNTVIEPRLKDVEVKLASLRLYQDLLDIVESNLKSLKEEYRYSLRLLTSELEETQNIFSRVKQDKTDTQEEIAKENSLLEGVECDLKNQEDQINKESQKLADEHNHYQKQLKEIMDEISQYNQPKLKDKKSELEKLEQNLELLKKRRKKVIERELGKAEELKTLLKVEMKKFYEKYEEFVKRRL